MMNSEILKLYTPFSSGICLFMPLFIPDYDIMIIITAEDYTKLIKSKLLYGRMMTKFNFALIKFYIYAILELRYIYDIYL